MSILILIPACNEAERLGAVLDGIRDTIPDAVQLVVDDGSEDATAAVAARRGAEVVRHPFNLGYGTALQTGYHYAKTHGFRRLVQIDGDGQHDAESIPALLAALEQGADVALGSRYRDRDAPPTTLARRLGSRLLSWLVTTWTGVRITDPTSGFQALNERALNVMVLDHFPEDYPDADVLIMLSRRGLRLCEVPVRMHERTGGVSMHRGGRALYYAYKMCLTLALLPIRRASPYRSGRAIAASTS